MMFGLIPVTVALLLGLLCCQRPALPGEAESFAENVDRIINSQDDLFSGVVFVAAGDQVLFNKGYGLADREFDVPNRPDTKFKIGSITKVFTAVLTMKLIELGIVDLDRPVSAYLTEFPQRNGQRITVRHLLNHTFGIPQRFIGIPAYFTKNDKYFQTPREYYSHFWETALAHEPGEQQTYSSPGYHLLSVILERASGRSYGELLDEHLLGPLGMKDTTVDNNLTVLPLLAKEYKKGACRTGTLRRRRGVHPPRGRSNRFLGRRSQPLSTDFHCPKGSDPQEGHLGHPVPGVGQRLYADWPDHSGPETARRRKADLGRLGRFVLRIPGQGEPADRERCGHHHPEQRPERLDDGGRYV